MKKVIDFVKQRYKIFIPIMVVFVLLLAVYFLYREYRYDTYRNRKETPVYQYFGGKKKEYTAIITYNLKKVIIGIEGKDKKINYDATPVYFAKEDRVLFPEEMSVILPLKSGESHRLYKYATYGIVDEIHKITNGGEDVACSHFFLFDGKGLYFFSDKVTLSVEGMDEITLGANSYIENVGGYTLTYYDKENDKAKILDIEGKEIIVTNDNYTININRKEFKVFGKTVSLGQPYNLNPLSNDWQIKVYNDIIKFRIGVL